jgi:hypothetical protein
MARGAESWCVQITALPQAGVLCRTSEMGARERCGRWIDGQRRGELAVLGELGWEVDERWLRARSGEERSVSGDDVAWAAGRWSVGSGSGYCSMVMPASACANAGLLDRNASGDACFDAPAAFCGGRIVSAPASGFVRVHSLDFGFAKAALMSETRAEAFLEAMMDGFVVERRFCSSR